MSQNPSTTSSTQPLYFEPQSKQSSSVASQLSNLSRQKRLISATHSCGSFVDETATTSFVSCMSSMEGDIDPNWNMDPDELIRVLLPFDSAFMEQMALFYPEQFEALPVPVRDYTKWKLYVKFCFFSGLPVAQNELHYKVRDDIAEQCYYGAEETILSHEVMLAATSSAELLTLPSRTVIRYIRKPYSQH